MNLYGSVNVATVFQKLIQDRVNYLESRIPLLKNDIAVYSKFNELLLLSKLDNRIVNISKIDYDREFSSLKAEKEIEEINVELETLKKILSDKIGLEIGSLANQAQITNTGKSEVKVGGSVKKFKAHFYDENGKEISIKPYWKIENIDQTKVIHIIEKDCIKIKIEDSSLIGTNFKLLLTDAENKYHDQLIINIVSLT